MIKDNVLVIGAGYVGLTFAVKIANEGYNVHCSDIDKIKLEELSLGKTSIPEKNLKKDLNKLVKSKKLSFSNNSNYKAKHIIIAISYFPKNPEKYINILHKINFEKKPVIYIRSTIPIGFINNKIVKFLENKKKLKLDKDFFIVSAPERTLSGDALRELSVLPQLIGGTSISHNKAKNFFENLKIESVFLGPAEAGELAKVYCNFSRLSHFNISNYLMSLCNTLDLNEQKIVSGIKFKYDRLNFLSEPGPGVGGFCLPKDSLVLSDSFKNNQNVFYKFPSVQYQLNISIMRKNLDIIDTYLKKKSKILILGIAFKGIPETDDFRESFGQYAVKYLSKKYKVYSFDKNIKYETLLKNKFNPIKKNQISKFENILIMNNNKYYKSIIKKIKNINFLYDPWRQVVKKTDKIYLKK